MKKLFIIVTCFVMIAGLSFANNRNMNPLPVINGADWNPTITSVKELHADVIVVGGGLSGMAAGLSAVQSGVDVIIFEKLPSLGGAGVFVEGSLGIGTDFQKKEGKDQVTVAEMLANITNFSHWRVNAALHTYLLTNSKDTLHWVRDEGVAFKSPTIKTMFPDDKSLFTWHIYKNNGASVTKNFHKKILKGGGKIFMETPVEKLITNEKGEVIGVEAINLVDGTLYKAYAKGGVVLATGSFANNRDMVEEHVIDAKKEGVEPIMLRGPLIDGREGDGIRMAQEVGAAVTNLEYIGGNSPYIRQPTTPPIRQFNGKDFQKQARTMLSQPFLWVNRQGKRFYNESFGSVFTDVYNVMSMNGGVMYSVFDDKMLKMMIKDGPVTPFNAIVVPGMPMKAAQEAIDVGLAEGWAYKANSIKDLAKQMGVDEKGLEQTIKEVNAMADKGMDPQFSKREQHLFKFSNKGPYYALKGVRAYFIALGGIVVNPDLEVLTPQEKVIPGLYAIGLDMGGIYDGTYDLTSEGVASGYALTSGRLVIKHIMRDRL